MRRRATVIAVAALAAVLPHAPARAQRSVPQIEPVPASITRLLDDYGRAFQTKDAGLLGRMLVGPLKETELGALANAADVPFRSFRVRATTQYSGNLASARIRREYPGQQVAAYHILEDSALDIEATPYADDGAFTFVRAHPDPRDRYDGWRLRSKSDLDILGFFSPFHLWDAGRVSVLRSAHFLLLTHPEVTEEMRPVLNVAERGYARATSFWPRPVRERYVILVPATTAELGQLIHATVDLEKFVAFVAAGASQEQGWEPTGPRMFVHLQHFRNYAEEGRLQIVAHELLHAITRPVTGPHIPSWVEEGLANTGGGNGARASQARSGAVPHVFPTDDRFASGPVGEIVVSYDQAQLAIEVLVERVGREGLAQFYERLGSARIVGGTDIYHVRRALKEALGWSVDDWLAEWRKRLG
jgi:hypothetical protein